MLLVRRPLARYAIPLCPIVEICALKIVLHVVATSTRTKSRSRTTDDVSERSTARQIRLGGREILLTALLRVGVEEMRDARIARRGGSVLLGGERLMSVD